MPQRPWRGQKKPPAREPEKPKKKTLQEHCQDLTADLAEARRAKDAAEKYERDREAEDEVMALLYGPKWRETAPMSYELEPQKKAS